jgi:hypothetical protein
MHQPHGRTPRTTRDAAKSVQPLPPGVRSLFGALRGTRLGVEDYREHLAEKYLGNHDPPRFIQGDSSQEDSSPS